jgi:carboxypeptidase C (cathepsin A)
VFGVTLDSGSCYILCDSNNTNSTNSNAWSWNQHVNMLYVDQPVTSGFSHPEAIQCTLDRLYVGSDLSTTGTVLFEAYNGSVSAENSTFLYSTYSGQKSAHTFNNSILAARTLWHFSQLWPSELLEHYIHNDRISPAGNP